MILTSWKATRIGRIEILQPKYHSGGTGGGIYQLRIPPVIRNFIVQALPSKIKKPLGFSHSNHGWNDISISSLDLHFLIKKPLTMATQSTQAYIAFAMGRPHCRPLFTRDWVELQVQNVS
jgi:hypothetical protein